MLQDTIIIDNTTYKLVHYFDTTECYEEVKYNCDLYWQTRLKNDSYENYRFDEEAVEWSLGPMLLTSQFDLGVTLLYIDDKLFSFGGIRTYTSEIALIMGRHFSFFSIKPINHAIMFPFQNKIVKEAGLVQSWVTVNNTNDWRRVWYSSRASDRRQTKSELYRLANRTTNTCVDLGMQIIHNVDQHILTWNV